MVVCVYMKNTNQDTRSTYIIAGAIVLAGLLVAGSIVFGGNNTNESENTNDQPAREAAAERQEPSQELDAIRPVTEGDFIRGDVDAPIKIVEYADFECPFCKRFHNTMNQLRTEYDGDEVAWVFRHFPLTSLHPQNAVPAHRAAECAAKLGGGDKAFWQFADSYFEKTPSNDRVDLSVVLPEIQRELGLDEAAFQSCVESDQFDDQIQADFQNARETGGQGTPWSILIGPDGEKFPINGAQPLGAVRALIENVSQ